MTETIAKNLKEDKLEMEHEFYVAMIMFHHCWVALLAPEKIKDYMWFSAAFHVICTAMWINVVIASIRLSDLVGFQHRTC